MLYNLDYVKQRVQNQEVIVFIIMKVIIRESRLIDLAVYLVHDRFPDLIEEPIDN